MTKTYKKLIAAALCVAVIAVLLSFFGRGAFGAAFARDGWALHAGSEHVTVTNDGYDKYNVQGACPSPDKAYVFYDGIEVPQDGKIYLSLDVNSAPYDSPDSWLTFMVGSDPALGAYGPTTPFANGKGPYYSQLMRCRRAGITDGNYFVNGAFVNKKFEPMETSCLEMCLSYSGKNVTVYINGRQAHEFTAADASVCYISFAWHSVNAADEYDFDLFTGRKAVCAHSEYDLAKGEDYADVPLKLMGCDTGALTLFNESGEQIPAANYSVQNKDGLEYLRLSSALLAEEEDGSRTFLLQSGGERSSFTVTTVDGATAAVKNAKYDFARSDRETRLPIAAGALTDIRLYDGDMKLCEGCVIGNEIVFAPRYFTDYGEYEFYTEGRKSSGKPSELYRFTVTVYDSRMPYFANASAEIDYETAAGELRLACVLYDARIKAVKINGLVLSEYDYDADGENLTLSERTIQRLEYGDNSVILVTDKNEIETRVIKTDGRAPAIAESVTVDKGDKADYYVIKANLYAHTALSVTVGDNVLANGSWVQIQDGLRIDAAALEYAPQGTTLVIEFESGKIGTTLTVINASAPEALAVHHYDAMFESDAVIEFESGVCDYAGLRLGGAEFGFAEYKEGVLRINGGWFGSKTKEGSYRVGDEIYFEAVWRNRHTGAELTSGFYVRLYDSAIICATLKNFDKRDESFLLPVFANGYGIEYVSVNGEYTTAYEVRDDGVLIYGEWMREQTCGEMVYKVYTSAQVITLENKLQDTRSAVCVKEAVYNKGDKTANGCTVEMEFYENDVAYVSDVFGNAIAAYNCEIRDNGIFIDALWLSEQPEGYCWFKAGMRRKNGDLTEQEELVFYVRIIGASKVTVSASEYDLAWADDIELNVGIGGETFEGIKKDGEWLRESCYMRVDREIILLRGDYAHTLGTGAHDLYIVTNAGETKFTLNIADSRTADENKDGSAIQTGGGTQSYALPIALGILLPVAAVAAVTAVLMAVLKKRTTVRAERSGQAEEEDHENKEH